MSSSVSIFIRLEPPNRIPTGSGCARTRLDIYIPAYILGVLAAVSVARG